VSIQPGGSLLHYRIVEKIGEGGMGVVWKGVDTTLDREVAKVLPLGFVAHGQLKKIPVNGATPLTIRDCIGTFRGADWGAGDVIALSPTNHTPIMTMSASGGARRRLRHSTNRPGNARTAGLRCCEAGMPCGCWAA